MMLPQVATTPQKYAGQWVAWNDDHTQIIAGGSDMAEVEKQAQSLVGDEYWLDKIPSSSKPYAGSATLE